MPQITTDVTTNRDVNGMIHDFMSDMSVFLESQIKAHFETLQLYQSIIKGNPNDTVATQQADVLFSELQEMIQSLMELRKDSEFLMPEIKGIISSMENAESICPDCGEQVTITGPTGRPDLDKRCPPGQTYVEGKCIKSDEALGKKKAKPIQALTRTPKALILVKATQRG